MTTPFGRMRGGTGTFNAGGWNTTNYVVSGGTIAFSGANNQIATFADSPAFSAGAMLGVVGRSAGKRYFEIVAPTVNWQGAQFGLSGAVNPSTGHQFGGAGYGIACTSAGISTPALNLIRSQDSGVANSISQNISSIAMVAIDFGNLLFWAGTDGTWANTGFGIGTPNPATGTGGAPIIHTLYYPAYQVADPDGSPNTSTLATLLSQFAYTPPTGFAPWGQ